MSQLRKRRISSSPENTEDSSPKHSKIGKRWKGGTSTEFQQDLLEEMGVSMLPETSEEDKGIEAFASSSEENENIDSHRKKSVKKKKKKREPFKFLGPKPNETQSINGCLNNNPLPAEKLKVTKIEDAGGNEKENGSSDVVSEPELERYVAPVEKEELQGYCFTENCSDSTTKENSRNLKWEKLKPVNCKIRNSKIIYQNEVTMIENDSKAEKERSKSKVDQGRKSRGERKVNDEDDGDFFLCRRSRVDSVAGEDQFEKLSDEVILGIFKWLPKKTLVRCTLVCKRFLRLAYDEALWARMDLGGRNLPTKAVGYIVTRGFRILRLAQAALPDPVYCPKTTPLPDDFVSKLQYLDLSMASISGNGLSTLLNFCRNLKKLSVENCHVNTASAAAISRNSELEVLNLTMCTGLIPSSIDAILTNCRRLQSLNISWTMLSTASLDVIACKIPSRLERLNISGCRKHLTDQHVLEIFCRCDNLIELDVSDSIELTNEVIYFIVKYVKTIEYLSFSRCYSISTSSFMMLKNVESLMYLDVFGLMKEEELNELKNELADVAINQFPFSSVARPTVGLRRTSIWGLRVRD
ncbi:UNVERIFIED_CONTAM: hypothetical protein PYX00_004478 [Menopon gallinae]|uniref:F-box domain-containing protein n=1 Tax=Menopon gallinae TaxID=328185 RepID=A0AAW2I5F7_9NEOP